MAAPLRSEKYMVRSDFLTDFFSPVEIVKTRDMNDLGVHFCRKPPKWRSLGTTWAPMCPRDSHFGPKNPHIYLLEVEFGPEKKGPQMTPEVPKMPYGDSFEVF